MELEKRKYQFLKWISRVLATALIAFGLPFYFGYGNPLPFMNPDYSVYDNIWLVIFPLMFIRLRLVGNGLKSAVCS